MAEPRKQRRSGSRKSSLPTARKQGEVGPGRPPKEYQFKPGQSGNPSGRPKNSIATLLRDILDADDQKNAKAFAQALLINACKGNGTAIRELLNRIDGPVAENRSPDIDLKAYGFDPSILGSKTLGSDGGK